MGELRFSLLLSLGEMSRRKVVALLWSGSDILVSISKFRYDRRKMEESEKEWQETFEPKIKDKVLKLELPKSLTEQMLEIIRPLGLQIKRWKDLQEYNLSAEVEEIILPDSSILCWTSAGLLDYRKTAIKLVRCDVIDVVLRYKLACINCLKYDIALLWEKLPEEKKDYFYYKVMCQMPLSPFLPFCWPHILKGELSKLDYLVERKGRNLTFNQWAFERSAQMGNKMATKYFLQKIKLEGKRASLALISYSLLRNIGHQALKKGLFDVLFYLLPLISHEQQREILNHSPVPVFFFFLDWPCPDLFLKNSFILWRHLFPFRYDYLLQEIHSRFKNSDPNIQKLFPEFFKQSPFDFKKYFVNSADHDESERCPARHFLEIFLESEDSESIKAIFRNVDAEDRVRLALNPPVLYLFHQFVLKDKLHMVEMCLREAMLSEEDRKRVKEAFMEFLFRDRSKTNKFKRIFEFLDEADTEKKGEKRKLEDC